MPRIAKNYQKLEEAKKDPPQSFQIEHGPDDTLLSNFLSPAMWENTVLLFEATKFVVNLV